MMPNRDSAHATKVLERRRRSKQGKTQEEAFPSSRNEAQKPITKTSRTLDDALKNLKSLQTTSKKGKISKNILRTETSENSLTNEFQASMASFKQGT